MRSQVEARYGLATLGTGVEEGIATMVEKVDLVWGGGCEKGKG